MSSPTVQQARLRAALDRVAMAVPAAIQLAVAAMVAYSFCFFVLGHERPLIAITVTLSSLGFVRDARPRRVFEAALGLSGAIVITEVVVTVAGSGWWQLGLVVGVSILVASALHASRSVTVAAASQAGLVMMLPIPIESAFKPTIDSIVAGTVALAATALLPRDPVRTAVRDADTLFTACRLAIDDLVHALRAADGTRAEVALESLRATQPALDDWKVSLDSAAAIARISPFLRRHRTSLATHDRIRVGMDLAVRSLRIVARRVDFLVRDGRRRPALADLLGAVGASIDLIGRSLRDESLRGVAVQNLRIVIDRLDPRLLTPEGAITESMIVVLVRPLVIDLLIASGVPPAEARAALPDLD